MVGNSIRRRRCHPPHTRPSTLGSRRGLRSADDRAQFSWMGAHEPLGGRRGRFLDLHAGSYRNLLESTSLEATARSLRLPASIGRRANRGRPRLGRPWGSSHSSPTAIRCAPIRSRLRNILGFGLRVSLWRRDKIEIGRCRSLRSHEGASAPVWGRRESPSTSLTGTKTRLRTSSPCGLGSPRSKRRTNFEVKICSTAAGVISHRGAPPFLAVRGR